MVLQLPQWTCPASKVQLLVLWLGIFFGRNSPRECLGTLLLNQARADHRPARAWFLEIVPVQTSVCVFVCVRPEAINN